VLRTFLRQFISQTLSNTSKYRFRHLKKLKKKRKAKIIMMKRLFIPVQYNHSEKPGLLNVFVPEAASVRFGSQI